MKSKHNQSCLLTCQELCHDWHTRRKSTNFLNSQMVSFQDKEKLIVSQAIDAGQEFSKVYYETSTKRRHVSQVSVGFKK